MNINIDQLGETLVKNAREVNREILRYYGYAAPEMKRRNGFNGQISLIRDLGIPVELVTNEDPGKELYTAITIAGQHWTI
jgi:hypothetical protein